jgi:hypothetical protein
MKVVVLPLSATQQIYTGYGEKMLGGRATGPLILNKKILQHFLVKKQEDFMQKSEMNFKDLNSLDSVRKVINEANEALNDKSRTIDNSAIPEALAGALGAGAGGVASFAALYFGGSVVGLSAAGITSGLAAAGAVVGGGMAVGVAVLAAPVVILGGAAIVITSLIKNNKLAEEKHALYTKAVSKQNAILELLKDKAGQSAERIEYLTSLNTILQAAIKDLKHDLA